jgi:hypothetical protein
MKKGPKVRQGNERPHSDDIASPEFKKRLRPLSKLAGKIFEEHGLTSLGHVKTLDVAKEGLRGHQRREITSISDFDLVLFALYVCGGAEHPVNTEDVAAQVFRYVPGKERYKWERHDYPDKEKVADELCRMENAKPLALVKADVIFDSKKDRKDNWELTEAGVERIRKNRSRFVKVLDLRGTRETITGTTCYQIFLKDRSLAKAHKYDMAQVLYCLADASKLSRAEAFGRRIAEAKDIDAVDLIEFLETMKARFRESFP